MNEEEFVKVIKEVVTESTVKSVEELITNPPGRAPKIKLVELSNWFKSLDNNSKDMVRRVLREAADDAVFGFLCVLDGVRAIESSSDKGKLILYFEKGGNRVLLNDFNKDLLHDIYKSL